MHSFPLSVIICCKLVAPNCHHAPRLSSLPEPFDNLFRHPSEEKLFVNAGAGATLRSSTNPEGNPYMGFTNCRWRVSKKKLSTTSRKIAEQELLPPLGKSRPPETGWRGRYTDQSGPKKQCCPELPLQLVTQIRSSKTTNCLMLQNRNRMHSKEVGIIQWSLQIRFVAEKSLPSHKWPQG